MVSHMDKMLSTERLSCLVKACQELGHARDMAALMAVVRRAARQLTGADGATFVLLDRTPKGDFCHYVDEEAIGPLWKGQRYPAEACISGWAMRHRATAVIPDIYTDPRIPVDLYEPTFVRSLVMVPIRRADPIGAIGTYWQVKRAPVPEEVELLEALAEVAAATIELITTYQDLEQRVRQRTAELTMREAERTANIDYARRVQEAMLPEQSMMGALLREHFVLYRPKDIVSGDFYWLAYRDGKVFVAVADCTGHGVTGALLSAMCSNQLDRALNEFGFTDPGMLLDMTRELIWDRLSKHTDMADGMDISLCVIERSTQTVRWSGAFNDLLYVQDGAVHQVRAHREAVGRTENRSRFPTHTLSLGPGTVLYLMTDGFADQFGGPKAKKFRSAQLVELLRSVHHLPMAEQKVELQAAFTAWKQGQEQVDDVTIIGIRL